MRFFFRKKDQPRLVTSPDPYRIELSGRNYDELDECTVALKFWLPESVETKIDEMCSFQDTSASDLIRQILFVHLYGRYDLFGLIERQNRTYLLNSRPKFSLAPKAYSAPTPKKIEKNIADIKVWVPARMKEDIVILAKTAGKMPSVYMREVVITHLFGHVPPEGISAAESPPEDFNEIVFSGT
jgi:hypothetical protein